MSAQQSTQKERASSMMPVESETDAGHPLPIRTANPEDEVMGGVELPANREAAAQDLEDGEIMEQIVNSLIEDIDAIPPATEEGQVDSSMVDLPSEVKERVVICDTDKLPPAVRQQVLDEHPSLYPPTFGKAPFTVSTEHIFSLRGKDGPSHLAKDVGSTYKRYKASVRIECSTGEHFWLGQVKGDAISKAPELRAAFCMDTQMPYISLITPWLQGGSFERNVSMTLFPRHIRVNRATDWSAIKHCTFDEDLDPQELAQEQPGLVARATTGLITRMQLSLTRDMKPVTGMTASELNQVCHDFNNNRIDVSDKDRLVCASLKATRIDMFFQTGYSETYLDKTTGLSGLECVAQWIRHVQTIFSMNATPAEASNRHSFFYRAQTEAGLIQDDMRGAVVPRWLVKSYQWKEITYSDSSTETVELKPRTWAHFAKMDIFPDPMAYAAYLRLGLVREVSYQTRQLTELVQSRTDGDKDFQASFQAVPDEPGYYCAMAYFRNPENLSNEQMVIASNETRVEIKINVTVEGKTRTNSYTGDVQGSIDTNPDITFCCVVRGPVFNFIPGQKYDIFLTMVDDQLPNERRMAAAGIIAAMDPKNKNRGPDIQGVFLGEPTPAPETDALQRDTTPAEFQVFEAIIRAEGLNPGQEEAALNTTQSRSGINIIPGPPGTGKSKVSLAITAAHASLGRRVAFTCGQNGPIHKAVEELEQWRLRNPNSNIHEDEYVLFLGAFAKCSSAEQLMVRQHQRKIQADADAGAVAAAAVTAPVDDRLRIAAELYRAHARKQRSPLYKYTFGYKLHEQIKKWATVSTSVHATSEVIGWSAYYLSLQDKIPNAADAKSRKELRVELNNVEQLLGVYYLENVVKIVFCTHSMACHPLLLDGFQPKVIVVEEAAHTTATNILTTVAAFHESVLEIVFSGDDKQFKPMITAQDCNEAHGTALKGLFTDLRENKQGFHTVNMLKECYRMAPYLLDFPSTTWYKGELTAHPSVEGRDSELVVTMTAYLESRAGKAWNGNPRVAFDVSGEEAAHEHFEGSVSRFNRAEADRIINELIVMLSFRAPKDGRKILPSDVEVLTPYTGMAKHICQEVKARTNNALTGINISSLEDVGVSTVTQAQGEEYPIVLCAFVTNTGVRDPEDSATLAIKWIAQGASMCVTLTRAKHFLLLYGNFRTWAQMDIWKHPHMNMAKAFKKFITELRSSGDIIMASDTIAGNDGKLPEDNSFNLHVRYGNRSQVGQVGPPQYQQQNRWDVNPNAARLTAEQIPEHYGGRGRGRGAHRGGGSAQYRGGGRGQPRRGGRGQPWGGGRGQPRGRGGIQGGSRFARQ